MKIQTEPDPDENVFTFFLLFVVEVELMEFYSRPEMDLHVHTATPFQFRYFVQTLLGSSCPVIVDFKALNDYFFFFYSSSAFSGAQLDVGDLSWSIRSTLWAERAESVYSGREVTSYEETDYI